MGKFEKTIKLQIGNQKIDISDFSPGFYFIQTENKEPYKFIKL
jgi:hypothetical protein